MKHQTLQPWNNFSVLEYIYLYYSIVSALFLVECDVNVDSQAVVILTEAGNVPPNRTAL